MQMIWDVSNGYSLARSITYLRGRKDAWNKYR